MSAIFPWNSWLCLRSFLETRSVNRTIAGRTRKEKIARRHDAQKTIDPKTIVIPD